MLWRIWSFNVWPGRLDAIWHRRIFYLIYIWCNTCSNCTYRGHQDISRRRTVTRVQDMLCHIVKFRGLFPQIFMSHLIKQRRWCALRRMRVRRTGHHLKNSLKHVEANAHVVHHSDYRDTTCRGNLDVQCSLNVYFSSIQEHFRLYYLGVSVSIMCLP